MTLAVVDRLVHHVTIFEINGYRSADFSYPIPRPKSLPCCSAA